MLRSTGVPLCICVNSPACVDTIHRRHKEPPARQHTLSLRGRAGTHWGTPSLRKQNRRQQDRREREKEKKNEWRVMTNIFIVRWSKIQNTRCCSPTDRVSLMTSTSWRTEKYNLITTPFMLDHFNTFPINAAAGLHSVAHSSLSRCHSLLSDRLKVKAGEEEGGGGRVERRGEAGLTVQVSSWLMGISRCPVWEAALEESHKKTSSIDASMCLSVCLCASRGERRGMERATEGVRERGRGREAPVCLCVFTSRLS